ncbi:MAG: hypothetical protein ACTJGH_00270 [Peptoniphilaceae bacterium]
MGREATKSKDNVYYKARIEASKYNEKLKSREGASEMLGVHPSTLADYELNTLKCPQPDKVVLMSDLYNAPELMNYFCSTECPIGCNRVEKLEVEDLDRITIKTISTLKNVEMIQDTLIQITEDGVIDDTEKDKLDDILGKLQRISRVAGELEIWVKKNLEVS